MNSHYSIKIPVKPYIQKFISTKEGNPILAINRSIVWDVIRPYLEYKTKDNLSQIVRVRQVNRLYGIIQIQVSISKIKNYGINVRPQSIILINRFLDNYFGKELYWHVRHCEKNAGRYKGYYEAINQFVKKFNIEIEDDISLDALLKMYYRQRNYENKSVLKKSFPLKN